MLAIVYLLLGFVPPLIAGPLAGLAFVGILKRGKGWYLIPFWVLLVILNMLVVYWIASPSDEWFPISSFSACFFTPVASIVSLLLIRQAWRRLGAAGEMEAARKRWFTIGFVLIPALQTGMLVALLLFAPQLCKVGLLVCPD
jgi:hypothetical protein